jgi:hypothetical protein
VLRQGWLVLVRGKQAHNARKARHNELVKIIKEQTGEESKSKACLAFDSFPFDSDGRHLLSSNETSLI